MNTATRACCCCLALLLLLVRLLPCRVARDVAGSKFSWTYPYNLDKASGAYVKQGLINYVEGADLGRDYCGG